MSDDRLDLPLRTSADTDGNVSLVLAKLESIGKSLAVTRAVANSSSAFRPFIQLASGLTHKSPLPPADREVAVLYLAALRGAEYEWREHVVISARHGIDDRQRDALRRGRPIDPSLFSAGQLLALKVTTDIVDEEHVDAQTWAQAGTTWGREAAFDLVLAVCFWGGMVPTLVKVLGLQDPSDQ